MDDLNKYDIENVCRELSKAFQGTLTWKWDQRFETVLAEFDVGRKNNIRATLEPYLSATWDSSNISSAPDTVRVINDQLGGFMPGQFLLTSDAGRNAVIFCAWWPWGDGKTISIRVGPWYTKLSDSERAENLQQFKGWFGVSR